MAAFVLLFIIIGFGADYFLLGFCPAGVCSRYSALSTVRTVENYDGTVSMTVDRGIGFPLITLIALITSLVMSFNSMTNSRQMIIRAVHAFPAKMFDDKVKAYLRLSGDDYDIDQDKVKQFVNVVSEMSVACGLPMPEPYIIPDSDLNAFAAGINPKESVIAVTEGLLNSLNREELQGVVGHEMSHIRNYDTRYMTVAAALAGAIGMISNIVLRLMIGGGRRSSGGKSNSKSGDARIVMIFFAVWLLLVILAPVFSSLITMAISRRREFLADASSAELTRNPQALISALQKIEDAYQPTKSFKNAGIEHMCIADPNGASWLQSPLKSLLSTHPSTAKRIEALKEMAYQ